MITPLLYEQKMPYSEAVAPARTFTDEAQVIALIATFLCPHALICNRESLECCLLH